MHHSVSAEKPASEAVAADALQQALRPWDGVLERLPLAICAYDRDGTVLRYNRRAAELWGRRPACGDVPMGDVLETGAPVRDREIAIRRPDRSRATVLASLAPLLDRAGRVIGAVACLQDITAQRRAEARRKLLVDELNHRVKNTLATVQSIAARSFRDGYGGQAQARFEGRLMALSQAHDVLTRRGWDGADLRELAQQAARRVDGTEHGRVEIAGPEVTLPPRMALAVAMTLHELAINAARHGALSDAKGRVCIDWRRVAAGDGEHLEFHWTERDGPPVEPLRRKGLGCRLIEQGLPREFAAAVALSFPRDGVVCAIDMVLP